MMPITSLFLNKYNLKYKIEDDIDFYSELNKPDDCEEILTDDKTCLITGKPLEQNSITLECKHSFNYTSLFKEVCRQKTYNVHDPMPLRVWEMKCPYCRQITNNILPFIPTVINKLVRGVNMPSVYCMIFKPCDHVFRQGSHKGDKCNKNGFESVYGNVCEKHYIQKEANTKKMLDKNNDLSSVKKKYENKVSKENKEEVKDIDNNIANDNNNDNNNSSIESYNNNNDIDIDIWTNEMQELYNSSTVFDIRKKLKENKLPVSGTKKVIIQRLLQHQQQ